MQASDTLLIARTRFGLTIAFPILFPSITIGLAWIVVYFRIQGALIVLPFIIAYTVFAYRVFRGKAPDKLYE